MHEYIYNVITRISFYHLNVLLLLGLALFGGTVGGRIFQKLKIPQVVGYIIIGALIGQSGLNIVTNDVIETLRPFNYFALGLIGFLVGGELKKDVFVKYGKSFVQILLWEGIVPFVFVTLGIGFIGSLIFGPKPILWALALLFGAIGSATDPASTTSVLKEYKSRGPLTAIIIAVIALDDGLALLLFAIATSVGSTLVGNGGGLMETILRPFYEMAGAALIGFLAGFILSNILKRYAERERILAFSIGTVLVVAGLALAANVSLILAAMTLGVVVVNSIPYKSKDVFNLVQGFTPPIYVLFFVLVGAKLRFSYLTGPIVALVAIYIFYCMTGKMAGARIGALLSKAPKPVIKYLPISLFSQAGIAIGLSILASQYFPPNISNTLVVVVTVGTFVTQIVGPPFTKIAIIKAQEAGLDITEEDIIRDGRALDLMDKKPPLIHENMQLGDILKIFSENDNLYYPVINKDRKLCGAITIEGIRQTFLETDIGGLILAHDLMEPVIAKVSGEDSISHVKEILDRYDIDYLPVVDKNEIIEGFIERKKLNKFVSTRIIELQKKADSLG